MQTMPDGSAHVQAVRRTDGTSIEVTREGKAGVVGIEEDTYPEDWLGDDMTDEEAEAVQVIPDDIAVVKRMVILMAMQVADLEHWEGFDLTSLVAIFARGAQEKVRNQG